MRDLKQRIKNKSMSFLDDILLKTYCDKRNKKVSF